MSTQGERQNYNWRPNDNSSQTRLRYDLEMNHWLKSLKGSGFGGGGSSGGSSPFLVIGLVIGLIFSLLWLILIWLSDFIVWVTNQFSKPEPTSKYRGWRPSPIKDKEKLDKLWSESTPLDIKEKYPY